MNRLAKQLFRGSLSMVSDKSALRLEYFRHFGRLPNLTAPTRFSEHLQVRKLADRDPRLPTLVDKIEVKNYVATTLGPEWVISTLWSGSHLDVETLERFSPPYVVKANHASGCNIFVTDHVGLQRIACTANRWLDADFDKIYREWAYKHVKRQLLIEPFVGEREPPPDYKIFTFHGEPRFIQVDFGRFTNHTRSYYSPEWHLLPIRMNYPQHISEVDPPRHLSKMLAAACKLASDLPFARVDFYDLPEHPLFGEMTFYPESGYCHFRPRAVDAEWGQLMISPDRHTNHRL